ncbi:helix-turn-helix domain-containing protein [Pseudogemmobacter sonorensis]|uniref:helix-turn-helix domain-containing protein n=1 Tax=Pseudogemmobacter sonorensis TaxID=2989681 RepID=UPI00368F7F3B
MIGWRSKPQAAEDEKPKGFDDFDLRLGDLMRGERATLGKSLLDVQRELKIKATYIAAIENADVSAFESPGFIAGYVRSYSRYLGMDPDEAFRRFCLEAGFTPAHGMSAGAAPARAAQVRVRNEQADPLASAAFIPKGESVLSRIEPGALGSLGVLVVLIGAIGYGGWSLLQEVQRVQLAPVDQAPSVVVSIDPLQPSGWPAAPVGTQGGTDMADAGAAAAAVPGTSSDAADRLYRPEALDVPVLTSRNGPIAAIDPRAGGSTVSGVAAGGIDAAVAEALAGGDVQVTAEVKPGVEVLAVRPAWVRIVSADGTVLLEKILDAGERFAVPALEEPARLRTGNSGGVYFVVNGETYGPAAPGANVVKDIALSAEALTDSFAEADQARDRDLERIMTADASSAVSTN